MQLRHEIDLRQPNAYRVQEACNQGLDLIDCRVNSAAIANILHGSRMDSFDVKLLAALQEDGRLTNFELADRVGLSASQCSRRRAALEEAGIIASYHARLDAESIGLGIVVFVQVTLATHSPDNSTRFMDLVENLDEVQEAYSLTGEADYLIKLALTDLKALSRILNEDFLAHDSVAHVRSSIVLDRLKQTAKLPLAHLRGDHATSEAQKIARRNVDPRPRPRKKSKAPKRATK